MAADNLVLIGMPLTPSYQSDVRIISQLERWDRESWIETYYSATPHTCLGRDSIVQYAQYRKPAPTHILFVDHDVMLRPNTLKRLLAHDKDIISGVYPLIRYGKVAWCLSRKEPFEAMPIDELPNNPFKAKVICNGIMLVKMKVFDNLPWPYWMDIFAKGKKMIGEDLYFCKLARQAGYDLWVDPKVKCGHLRTVDLLGIAMDYVKGKNDV